MSVISLTVDSCSLNYRAREAATPAYFCISDVKRANNVPTHPESDGDAERRLNQKSGEVPSGEATHSLCCEKVRAIIARRSRTIQERAGKIAPRK
jgi:hypothetical protein